MITTWFILFSLIIASFLTQKMPLWLPILLYAVVVIVRVKQKLGDYKDSVKKNKRNARLKLDEVSNDMADRGLTFSSIRKEAEKKVKEDFEFERKKAERKLWVDLAETLFLR